MSDLSDLEKVQYLMDAGADEIELDDYELKFLEDVEKQLRHSKMNSTLSVNQKTFLNKAWSRL